jgi:hypothetical protein
MALSNIALSQVGELKYQAPYLIDVALSTYEQNIEEFKVNQKRQRLKSLSLNIFNLIIERIINEESVSLTSLKPTILEGIFLLNFDVELSLSVITYVGSEVINFLKSAPSFDKNLVQYLEEYRRLLLESTGDFSFFIATSTVELLQKVPQYAYSDSVNVYKKFDARGYYSPLFSSDYLWENIKQRTINPEDFVIYERKLYKLRPNIKKPNTDFFDKNDWQEYSSSRFNKSASFETVYSQLINAYFSEFLNNARDINGAISNSEIKQYQDPLVVNSSILKNTFGGKGEFLYEAIKLIRTSADLFGGYEGSVVGSIEYAVQYMEYFLSSTRGRVAGSTSFNIIDNFNLFGNFEALFGVPSTEFKKPGLKFLDFFAKTKSFLNGKKVLNDLEVEERVASKAINPVLFMYQDGINDSYSPTTFIDDYADPPPQIDLLLLSIEALYNQSLNVGDTISAMINSLDKKGQLKGFEGLGSIYAHIYELQNAFPPSPYFSAVEAKNVGFTGAIKYLLENYKKFSSLLVYPILPASDLNFLTQWIDLFKSTFESILGSAKALGLDGTSNFIANMSNKIVKVNSNELVSYLKSIGFRDSEIEQLLNVNSFPELIEKFAPISDSSDLKSFFKGYELTQLIYEFAGQNGIDAYLNFLYSSDDVSNLLNVLSISLKDRNKITTEATTKYPKLIGLLIGLTYAIDSAQLVKFNDILKNNNLNLLESITYLLGQGERTIIKTKEEIELLSPVIDQLIQGNANDIFATPDLNYSQTNAAAPIALKNWTDIISNNLGNVKDKNFLYYLYDKAEGLSVKELNYILGGITSNTTLGAIFDGFQGGRLTDVLKYANISGLGAKLGFYDNSYQNNNFELTSSSSYTLPAFNEGIVKLIESINFISAALESSLDFSLSQTALKTDILKPIINSQNKSIESLFGLVQSLAPESRDSLTPTLSKNLGEITSTIGNSKIVEAPGIGNSRLPDRIGVLNSITPEQQEILFSRVNNLTRAGVDNALAIDSLINNFIKVSEGNKLLSGLNQVNEAGALIESKSKIQEKVNIIKDTNAGPGKKEFIKVSNTETFGNKEKNTSTPTLYISEELGDNKQVISQALGANYIQNDDVLFGADQLIKQNLISPFSRIESCKKFGGENCDEVYANEPETCTNLINKSLYSESYTHIHGSNNENLKVDRPLGTFAQYTPRTFIPNSKSQSQVFYDILPGDKVSIGKNGEPLLTDLYSDPVLFEGERGEISEYNNTEFALIEFINAKLEQGSEFNCASFSSPYFYQLCMNVLKCKRFKPSGGDSQYLKFCPEYYSGGRLKP